MKLWSDSWPNGERIPARFACGRLDGADGTSKSWQMRTRDCVAGGSSLQARCGLTLSEKAVPSAPSRRPHA